MPVLHVGNETCVSKHQLGAHARMKAQADVSKHRAKPVSEMKRSEIELHDVVVGCMTQRAA